MFYIMKEKDVNNKNTLKLISVFVIILLILAAVYLGLNAKKQVIDKGEKIAKVDDLVVYEADIQSRLNSIAPGTDIDLTSLPPEILKALVMEVSVNNKIDQEAKKLDYQNDPEIKQKVDNYKKELLREKFLNEQIYSKATEEKALEEYDKMVEHLKGKEERRIRHILVNDEEEIERARRSVMRSGNFEKVAKEKSIDTASAENGGDLGYVLQEELVPEFGDVAFILKVGEVSKPVKTQYGWHIIKIEDIRPATYLPFEEVKDGLIQRLQEQAIQEYLLSLTQDSNIEILINEKSTNDNKEDSSAENVEDVKMDGVEEKDDAQVDEDVSEETEEVEEVEEEK